MRDLVILFIHLIVTLARLAGSWRRPFCRRGVGSRQTSTPDPQSLRKRSPNLRSIRSHRRRFVCALDASRPPDPFSNCTETFDSVEPPPGPEEPKVSPAVLIQAPSVSPDPKGPSKELIKAVVEMKQRNPILGLSANRTADRLGVRHPDRQGRCSKHSRQSLPTQT